MNFLAMLAGFLQLIPTISQLVVAVETAMPKLAGSDKLAAVKATLQQAEAVGNAVVPVATQAWPVVETFIGHFVAAMHAVGTFTHANAAPAAATTSSPGDVAVARANAAASPGA